MKQVLLLADDDTNFRNVWQKVLTEEGYAVEVARNAQETREILKNKNIDLAILDVRLESEEENDVSGLEIATDQAFRHIPKIVLTAFPISTENLRSLLGLKPDELPSALSFINKAEGELTTNLLAAIRHALTVWPHLRKATAAVARQINADHETIRQQAQRHYVAAFVFSILGFFLLCIGIIMAWLDRLAIGLVGTTGGLLLEALGFLFFTRLDQANKRMDLYHTELVQTYWLEVLLAACEQLPGEKQVTSAEQVIGAAAQSWFFPLSSVKNL